MTNRLEQIKIQFEEDLAGGLEPAALRVKYLGRKSQLIEILRSIKELDPAERGKVGALANQLKVEIGARIDLLSKNTPEQYSVNVSKWQEPPKGEWQPKEKGHLHPLTYIKRRATELFLKLGFIIASGPEVESTIYNFDFLNFPQNHPARDMQDTFYLEDRRQQHSDQLLLRTHTSPVQVRVAQKTKAPIYLIACGRVFRNEATDASHGAFLHQIEGLAIDKDISLANLLWTLEEFAKFLFGRETKIRVRQSFFPFVEPGLEMDFSCMICAGSGRTANGRCSVCKGKGWIEIGGAGMVHSNVLENMGIDKNNFSGFAFGLGLDRLAMLLHAIPDIRTMYENDIRFIKQF